MDIASGEMSKKSVTPGQKVSPMFSYVFYEFYSVTFLYLDLWFILS